MPRFSIKSDTFEGPIDLLLTLIEKKKLHISSISLSQVTDDYINYINSLDESDVEETANFLSIASTLLLIKSVALLPKIEVTEEEQLSMEELQLRLRIYKRMREQGKTLATYFGANSIYFPNQARTVDPVFSPSSDISNGSLLEGIRAVINSIPKPKILKEVVVKEVRKIEDVIEELSTRIQKTLRTSFREFSGMGKEDKVNVVVSFLAMLELVKQGIVSVSQESNFSDIDIETSNPGLPTYT